jgi:RND family efflux transporter MFP subunit
MLRWKLLALFIVGSSLLQACSKPAEPPPLPRPALVVTAGEDGTGDGMALVGEIRPRYESAQGFRIGGKIVERRVEVGTVVRKGQLLARLDAADTGLSAQAAEADVRSAEADNALASAELERQRQLYEKKFISKSALDIREAQYKTSLARVEQAKAQAAVSGNQSRYTALLAERDGVVTEIHAEPGQVVSSGEVIARVAELKQMEVVVAVPESRMQGVKVGAPALVRLWASNEKDYPAKVREIAPAADTATRTFQVRVAIAQPDAAVRLGMTAGVKFGTMENAALLLPIAALTQRDGKNVVWVVDRKTNKVQPRAVETGPYREDGVLITKGVSAGELVVAAGEHTLIPGQTVRPMQAGLNQ